MTQVQADYDPGVFKALKSAPDGISSAEHRLWLVPNAATELEQELGLHHAHGAATGFDHPEAARLYKRLQRFFGGKVPTEV